nr:hypothetical protein CFP56_11768 [Quercus suber]
MSYLTRYEQIAVDSWYSLQCGTGINALNKRSTHGLSCGLLAALSFSHLAGLTQLMAMISTFATTKLRVSGQYLRHGQLLNSEPKRRHIAYTHMASHRSPFRGSKSEETPSNLGHLEHVYCIDLSVTYYMSVTLGRDHM